MRIRKRSASGAFAVMGVWDFEIDRRNTGRFGGGVDRWRQKNVIVDEALQYAIAAILQGGAQFGTWYIAPFQNNYTPVSTDVGSAFPGGGVANEMVDYDEPTRVAYVPVLVGTPPINVNNIAARAEFTFNNAVAVNLYGAFMISGSVKSALTDTLFAARNFVAPKNVVLGEVLRVGYTIFIASV